MKEIQVQKKVKINRDGIRWRTMENKIIHSSEMETSHLFNSVKMIYNHLAELIGFPTFWYTKKYEGYVQKWIQQPEQTMETLKSLIIELEDRTDWDSNQKDTYLRIRQTLSGGFHKTVFDELNKRGVDTSTIKLQNPLKLLMEAKDKYERKQLTSSN